MPVTARNSRKILFSVAMKNENYIEVKHLGLTIKVTRESASRFIVPDYTTGKRVRHVRTSEAAAKEKAKEICEILARGKVDDRIILTNDDLRYNIRKAMDAMATVGMEVRTGSELLVKALKIVPADELLDAVRFYSANKPDKPLRDVTVNEGVADFKVTHRAGAIREQNLSNYLEVFARNFGNRIIADIEQTDIEKWFAGQEWSAKTYNDALQMTSQFWKHAIKSRWAVKNPIKEIKRLKVPEAEVKIYAPDALKSSCSICVKKHRSLLRSPPLARLAAFVYARSADWIGRN